jgi:hypothetical protein
VPRFPKWLQEKRDDSTPIETHLPFVCTEVTLVPIGMDSDGIRTDTNADVTIYHILFRIPIRIRILSNTNTKWIFRIRIHIGILTRFTA